jgi:hypothetical protein
MCVDRIVCLANSYKHDNRCVAGISLISQKWVRLVGTSVEGGLTRNQTCYPDGHEAKVLDVFEAETGDECGSNYHPEDVIVMEPKWTLLRRFDAPADTRFLLACSNKRPTLMKSYSDRVFEHKAGTASSWIDHSLELIHPEDLWWWIREDKGKRKNRAVFRVGGGRRARYDLAVTDPDWLARMHPLPPGIYPHAQFFSDKVPTTFLTISLSEPFEGFHYKLVAGVVNLPAR